MRSPQEQRNVWREGDDAQEYDGGQCRDGKHGNVLANPHEVSVLIGVVPVHQIEPVGDAVSVDGKPQDEDNCQDEAHVGGGVFPRGSQIVRRAVEAHREKRQEGKRPCKRQEIAELVKAADRKRDEERADDARERLCLPQEGNEQVPEARRDQVPRGGSKGEQGVDDAPAVVLDENQGDLKIIASGKVENIFSIRDARF